MATLIPFVYNDQSTITVHVDGAGDPWWRAQEVCTLLGIRNARQACQRLDDDEKGVYSADTPGGVQSTTLVNEPGLYKLIMRSTKPEARMFQRWVTHDLLPQIRRTGRYEHPAGTGPVDGLLSPSRALLAAVQHLVAVEDRVGAVEQEVAQVKHAVDALKAHRPPQDKLTTWGYLKRFSKPQLPDDVYDLFKTRCRRLEDPEMVQPQGADHSWPYYTLATLETAYAQATRQLSFLDAPLGWSPRRSQR